MRRAAVYILITIGVVLGVLAVLTVYVRDTVIDSDEAAQRSVEALQDPVVRQIIGRAVVDQIVIAVPDALAARPLLEQIVAGALGAPAFQEVYQTAIRDLHRTVFLGQTDTFTVQLSDMVLVVKTQATALNPELGEQIPDGLTDTLIDIQSDKLVVDAVQYAKRVRILAFVLPLLAIITFAAAIAVATDRRRAMSQLGFAIIGIGLIVIVVEQLIRLDFVGSFENSVAREVAGVFWDSFASDLTVWGLGVAGTGAVLVSSLWWISEPVDITARLRQLRPFLEPPVRTWPRLLWILVWTIVGLLLILAWQESLRVVITLAGVVFLVNALGELLRMIAPRSLAPDPGDARPRDGRRPRDRAFYVRYRWAFASVGAIAFAGVIVGGGFAIARSGGPGETAAPAAPEIRNCNGYAALCDRRLNDVTFAATHNSFSSAEDGFVLANHSRGIIPQLDAGYRGLLIDIRYGIESQRISAGGNNLVVTDIAPSADSDHERARLVEQLGESTVRAAEELRRRSEESGGTREIYLCHGLCEIGASAFSEELSKLRDWLAANPHEVLIIIIEDYVDPNDVADAFGEAGLTEYLHTQAPGAPWPTLRGMIESGNRVMVMAEKNNGNVPWYHLAFDFAQETGFNFDAVDKFNCEPNRGSEDNPLFMINHWVTPASAEAGITANSAEVLNRRVAACQEERGLRPNIIGVDFYAQGDALQVVAELNGVR